MATVARHIRSYYDPETERDDLLLETGQVRESTSSGQSRFRSGIGFASGGEDGQNADNDDEEEEIDPWLVEIPYAPAKPSPQLKFVKSILSYEDVNDYIERGHGSGLLKNEQKNDKDVEEGRKGISSWYRNLSRSGVDTPVPPSAREESVLPLPQELPQPSPLPSANPRRRNDWFISNVLPQPSPAVSGSNSPTPGLRPPPTLADMLARDPPPNKSQEAYTPPTWIMLPPSNPGFQMLQKSGWSEGEPLGPYAIRKRDAVHREQQPVAGPSNLGQAKGVPEIRTTEIEIEGYDDIVEIRREQVIDLTLSDDGESAPSSDESVSDEDIMDMPGDETARSSDPSLTNSKPTSVRSSPPQREGHGGKALLTPLPTVLKSDRLGIGLKAKTVGPYKASQKRVTHNAAALAAHVKANEERRHFKQKVGRGSRGFARAQKRESEKRKNLLAYLNQ